MSRESLGHFELLVLLALLRHGDEAYGVPIAHAIEQSTGKRVILASVYNTLERLEEKGLVASTMGEPTSERGGRAKDAPFDAADILTIDKEAIVASRQFHQCLVDRG